MSAQFFIKDKAREISYALVRVAWYVKRVDLRSRLEALSVELLENSARVSVDNSLENVNRALGTISVLDGLVRLAHSLYEIEPVNATILVRELDNLNLVILQQVQDKSGNPAIMGQLPNLESFFSKEPNNDIMTAYSSVSESNKLNLSTNGNGVNTAIRQSAIINKIKLGNCRLKDVIGEFPNVSERTLRYDLEKLCNQGVIERVGNGGPASYYRLLRELPAELSAAETPVEK